MPVEIRELQISVTVNPDQAKEAAKAAPNSQESKDEKKAMKQQMLDEILQIMNNKKER